MELSNDYEPSPFHNGMCIVRDLVKEEFKGYKDFRNKNPHISLNLCFQGTFTNSFGGEINPVTTNLGHQSLSIRFI